MKWILVGLVSLFAVTSARADVVLVLNDAERAALVAGLAAGLQAQTQLLPQTIYLLNKINTAPVMTGQSEVKPDKPAEAKPQAEPPKDDKP